MASRPVLVTIAVVGVIPGEGNHTTTWGGFGGAYFTGTDIKYLV